MAGKQILRLNYNDMKHLLLSLLLLMSITATAQNLYNGSGSYRGKVSDGLLYNYSGSYRGKIDDGGRIYNRNGSYVGKIQNDYIYDSNGSYVGSYRNEKVYSRSGRYIGSISNGRIYDGTGKYIGKADNVPSRIIAVIYFFDFCDMNIQY
jgi:sporulation protein YlmC with PRC-barrel domain